jgi:hypothetical protein
MAVSFKQGEDKKIEVTVIENGLPTDLSVCTNIKALLHVNNVLQKRYAIIPETDHGKCEVDLGNTNQCNVYVERDDSKNFPVGAVSICLLCSFPNVDFIDGIEVREFIFNVGRVSPGCGINETI